MTFALSIVFWSIIVFIIYWFWLHIKLRRKLSKLPSPRSFPVLGHALVIKPDIQDFVDQLMAMALLYPEQPRICLLWSGFKPMLMIYSASMAEKLFTTSEHLTKGLIYDMLKPWLGDGLLVSKPKLWKPRRKLLTPTFHYDVLKHFISTFNYQCEKLVNILEKRVNDNGPLIDDILKPISLCALDIICETSMGQSINAQQESESEYVRLILRINDIIQNRQKNPIFHFDILFNLFGEGKEQQSTINKLHSFTKNVIQKRRETQEAEMGVPNEKLAFLDLLLEMERRGELDEKSVQEEVDTFMFEGHDTTATAATWAMHVFGCYPEVQQRVFEEIQQVCGDSIEITNDHLSQLKYLECCLKEILRLYPSVPLITRRLGKEVEIEGTMLPAGTEVVINIYLIHRDPAYWYDAEKFQPERFLPDNSVGRHPFAYIPFSAGSRNCIGQRFALLEEKVMITWLLRAFEVKSVARRVQQMCRTEIILRPKNGVAVFLVPRKAKNS